MAKAYRMPETPPVEVPQAEAQANKYTPPSKSLEYRCKKPGCNGILRVLDKAHGWYDCGNCAATYHLDKIGRLRLITGPEETPQTEEEDSDSGIEDIAKDAALLLGAKPHKHKQKSDKRFKESKFSDGMYCRDRGYSARNVAAINPAKSRRGHKKPEPKEKAKQTLPDFAWGKEEE